MSKKIALILFGGKGSRFSKAEAKQFHYFGDKMLCQLTLEKFEAAKEIDEIDLVSFEEGIQPLKEACQSISKLKSIFVGGSTRQESVKLALKALKQNGVQDDDIILIHDGDRPFVSPRIIAENIKMVEKLGAAITAIPSVDTVFLGKQGEAKSYLNRNEVYQAQTPQSFYFKEIYSAHMLNASNVTDDASLLIQQGKKVGIVLGEASNFKITLPEDEKLAISRLKQ